MGDFLVGINGVDTKWARHNDVVQLVRKAVDHMMVQLVTPVGKSYLDPQRSPSTSSMSTPTRMQSPSGSLASNPSTKGSTKGRLSAPWVFIRKQSSRETMEREHHTNSNVVLR